MIFKIIVFIIY